MSQLPEFTVGGKIIPPIGLGTWQAEKGEVAKSITSAIEAGYRHIDCASNYLNEAEIGDVLADLFEKGVVKREDLFITSKLNNPYHHKEHVRGHLLKTLKDLKLDYLDLWLMHWPVAFVYVPYDKDRRGFDDSYDPDGCSGVDLSFNNGSKIDSTVSVQETWTAMEEIYTEGLVRAIGVANFSSAILHDLLTYAKVKPEVNQFELHPYLQQNELVHFCRSRNIVVEGYSPLGTPAFKEKHEPSVLEDPTLNSLAKKYGKTPAQICLRWAVQRGTIPLPKSVNPDRLRSNISVFDFSLTQEEMLLIKSIDKNFRYLRPFDWYGIPLFS